MIEYRQKINSKIAPYGQVQIQVVNKKGVTRKVVKQPVDSFIYQYWQILEGMVHGVDKTLTSLNGSSVNFNMGTHYEMNGNAGAYTGIVVGTGTTPVAIDDNRLENIITHGTAAGQMTWGTCSRQIENSERDAHFTRTFTNNSGASINVGELGLAIWTATEDQDRATLILRDVLSPTISVADGESMIINYTFGWNVGNSNIKAYSSWWSDNSDDVWHRFNGGTASFSADSFDRMRNLFDSGNDRDGLIVGTGTTPPAVDDWDLENLIPHGAGAGQLDYGPTGTGLALDVANNNVKWTWERVFNNNSGADITINEVGLVQSSQGSFSNRIPMLFFRGVFGAPPTITAGTSRTVKVIFDYSI